MQKCPLSCMSISTSSVQYSIREVTKLTCIGSLAVVGMVIRGQACVACKWNCMKWKSLWFSRGWTSLTLLHKEGKISKRLLLLIQQKTKQSSYFLKQALTFLKNIIIIFNYKKLYFNEDFLKTDWLKIIGILYWKKLEEGHLKSLKWKEKLFAS